MPPLSLDERLEASPQFRDGRFQNPVETRLGLGPDAPSALRDYVSGGRHRVPKQPPPIVRPDPASLVADPGGGLRVTWMGHSTMLVELDGHLLLTDPVWSRRASPVQWAGPGRFHDPPLAIEDLPELDAVLLTHDHYDHLDTASVRRLARRGVRWVTSLGVGARLVRLGVAPDRVCELDWWEEARIGSVTVVAAPARHFSGRGLGDRNRTLWSSFALIGPHHRAWFSGDTGAWDGFGAIGERLGPFDLSMIEIGAYHPAWRSVHLGPDGAAGVHGQVGARVLMPVHWGTFSLAPHAWDQPIVRLQEVARAANLSLMVPLAGQTVDVATPRVDPFWVQRAELSRVVPEPVAAAAATP